MDPLIKYPGGKGWFVETMKQWFEPYRLTHAFVEPFAGSLALSLGLEPNRVIANDLNSHVINLYQQIKNGFQCQREAPLIRDDYYAVKEEFNALIKANNHCTHAGAELFYILTKSCFNGLVRFNRAGLFNTSAGRYKKVNLCSDFSEYQQLLSHWQLSDQDFRLMKPQEDWFLVLDPPYHKTFTGYSGAGFNWNDQKDVVEWVTSYKTGPVIITNSATDEIINLYRKAGFHCYLQEVRRSISCKGSTRKNAVEVIACKWGN
jgi:DNA adenine methylase Dam